MSTWVPRSKGLVSLEIEAYIKEHENPGLRVGHSLLNEGS